MRGKAKKGGRQGVDDKRIFRHWIDIRDVETGSVRSLPLTAMAKIYIPTGRSNDAKPSEEVLRLEDGETILEAKNLEELATQLRERYPDGAYERTLHGERDIQAEERRAAAMHRLIEILAEAAAREIFEGKRAPTGSNHELR